MTSLTTASAQPAPKPKLLDRLREAIRVRHYSIRTEEAYVQWVRRFIFFHNKRHPDEMGRAEVEAFLTHLAVEGHVAAATQNQALNAIVFLYKEVLRREVGQFENLVWARRSPRVPVVLTLSEVKDVLERIDGVPGLMARILYGSRGKIGVRPQFSLAMFSRRSAAALRLAGRRPLHLFVRRLYCPLDRLLGSSAGLMYVSTNGPGPST